MQLILLISLLSANGQNCQGNEFWFSNTSCESCSAYIDHSLSCESGDWSPIINGSFESPIVPGDQKVYTSIPGWTSDINIELRKENTADGFQYLDTAYNINQVTSQSVTTQADYYYTLEFAYSPRPGKPLATMEVSVLWDSQAMLTVGRDGTGLSDTSWTYHSLVVKASSSTSTLAFESIGQNDGFGGLIDDVKINTFPSVLSCETGYSVSVEENSCILCPSNCEECEKQASDIVCSSCADKFYVLNGECSSCPSYCKTCGDSTSCAECLGSFELENNFCQCPQYYLLDSSTETCSYFPLRATFALSQDSYLLTFSEDLNSNLELVNLRSIFIPSNTAFEFSVTKLSSKEYRLGLETDQIEEGSTRLGLEIHNVKGISGSDLLDKYFEVDLPLQNQSDEEENESEEGKETEEKEKEESEEQSQPENKYESEEETEIFFGLDTEISALLTVLLCLASSLTLSLISMNSNALWSFLSVSVMIYFLPVQNTSMHSALKQICKQFDSDLFGIIPNLGELLNLKEEDYESSLKNWKDYEIKTDSFFLNAGNIISVTISKKHMDFEPNERLAMELLLKTVFTILHGTECYSPSIFQISDEYLDINPRNRR